MNDDDNFARRLYDPSHPLYVSSAAEDGLARLTKNRDDMPELGPWGARLLYAGLAVVAAYFGFILVFGTHGPRPAVNSAGRGRQRLRPFPPRGFGSCSM